MRTFHTGGVRCGHHAWPPARRRDLRGAKPERRGEAREVGGRVEIEQTERGPRSLHTPDGDDRRRISSRADANARRGGQEIEAGDALHEGSRTPVDLLRLKGATATELYLVSEVQRVYSRGCRDSRQHIELIVRRC